MGTPQTSESTRTHAVRIQIKTPPARIDAGDQVGTTRWQTVDRQGLEREIASVVRGEVRFSDGDRAMYASDAGNYRMVPLGVVLPRDAVDVLNAVAACRRRGVPIFARGGGTGIPGRPSTMACCSTSRNT